MNLTAKMQRIDNGCEPVIIEETQFPSLAVAREVYARALDQFNTWADKTNQSRLSVTIEMAPTPAPAEVPLSPKEQARLDASQSDALKFRRIMPTSEFQQ